MESIIFGAGSHLGVHVDGAAFGAEHLIHDMHAAERRLLMQDLKIEKSRARTDRRKNEQAIEAYNTRMYDAMMSEIRKGIFPILVGGDHSVAVVSALAGRRVHGNIGIIWIDAHTDYHTFDSTETGNIHGLPLAAITGYHNEELRRFHTGGTIDPHHAVVVGARSVDPGEWLNLRDAGVTVFSTEDVQQRGVEAVMEDAFRIAGAGMDGVHVSYDLDVIDPQVAPGVSVPEKDGLSEAQALEAADLLVRHIREIHSFDLVELNPLRDPEGRTEAIAVEILNRVRQAVKEQK